MLVYYYYYYLVILSSSLGSESYSFIFDNCVLPKNLSIGIMILTTVIKCYIYVLYKIFIYLYIFT